MKHPKDLKKLKMNKRNQSKLIVVWVVLFLVGLFLTSLYFGFEQYNNIYHRGDCYV